MDGELGAYVRGQISKANLVVMDKIWDNGFRQITSSNKPIQTPDDLKGFKIRVPVSPLWTSMFTRLRLGAGQHQLRRGLHRAADQGGRRPGEPARDHLHREALRSAEILLHDQPHVGRLLVPGQPPRLGAPAGGSARDRGEATSTRRPSQERADVAKLNASRQRTSSPPRA